VLNRRNPTAAKPAGNSAAKLAETDTDTPSKGDADVDVATVSAAATRKPAPDKPAPGARPSATKTGRPSGKRNPRR
jgi:preprotein translocase subunit SecF